VKYSISIPQLAVGAFDAEAFKSYLMRAEELGFEGGWTLEMTIGAGPLIAPMEMLAYAAACTTRLRLGVGVLVTSLHDPLQLASIVTAVDRLSHGRLDVGVATGGRFRQFPAFGVDGSTFVRSFTEGLELMKAAWSDAPHITFDGRFRRVDDAVITPKPVQRPHPPIWFGASVPSALARAVRHGDGFLGAGVASNAHFAELVAALRRELALQDRDPASFPISKRVYLIVDDDAAQAYDRVIAGLHRYYGPIPGIEHAAISGTPEDVARGLEEAIGAGAQTILLNPLGASVTEDREQMERLAAEVIPRLS
jgi:alkanesulfonate monooxygenase SsuD/methylene tetrahydromethanopterin reductase-like flavin-dependent oxidoreductase (luciferase family)